MCFRERLLVCLFHLLGFRIPLEKGPLALIVDDLALHGLLDNLVAMRCLSKDSIEQCYGHRLKQGVFQGRGFFHSAVLAIRTGILVGAS